MSWRARLTYEWEQWFPGRRPTLGGRKITTRYEWYIEPHVRMVVNWLKGRCTVCGLTKPYHKFGCVYFR